MKVRSNVLLCNATDAVCGVCAWEGRLCSYDLSLGRHLCSHCIEDAISAEALLRAHGLAHPPTGLIFQNP